MNLIQVKTSLKYTLHKFQNCPNWVYMWCSPTKSRQDEVNKQFLTYGSSSHYTAHWPTFKMYTSDLDSREKEPRSLYLAHISLSALYILHSAICILHYDYATVSSDDLPI